MSVDGVAAEVVEVLARARSLFAAAAATHPDALDAAPSAEASAAIARRTDEMSGSFAEAHRDALDEVSTELHHAAHADAALAEQISSAADTGAAGAADAEHLHAAAAGLPGALGPWSELPAAELGALKALRQHVAGMQQLMSDHTAEAQRLADAVAALEYGQ